MTRDRAAQEAVGAASCPKNPILDDTNPELLFWKEVDRQLIRKGMDRIDRSNLDFKKLVEKYWGRGTPRALAKRRGD